MGCYSIFKNYRKNTFIYVMNLISFCQQNQCPSNTINMRVTCGPLWLQLKKETRLSLRNLRQFWYEDWSYWPRPNITLKESIPLLGDNTEKEIGIVRAIPCLRAIPWILRSFGRKSLHTVPIEISWQTFFFLKEEIKAHLFHPNPPPDKSHKKVGQFLGKKVWRVIAQTQQF